ncbi:hypothetical protein Pan258_30220 [Symmachiella dynata]|uniref:Uncharacterized protein n=1 Tax=Symmachiella dynata TaxID=2527995 RepID=A0A517ZQ67_9PLAN|nr:hypothetical protein Pan258_30220 [Symmachiella dynata]QDU44635.1 hypothetical protein Mal52_31210 [Symmachiella dynata]
MVRHGKERVPPLESGSVWGKPLVAAKLGRASILPNDARDRRFFYVDETAIDVHKPRQT